MLSYISVYIRACATGGLITSFARPGCHIHSININDFRSTHTVDLICSVSNFAHGCNVCFSACMSILHRQCNNIDGRKPTAAENNKTIRLAFF